MTASRGLFAARIIGSGLLFVAALALPFGVAAWATGDAWRGFATTFLVAFGAGMLAFTAGSAQREPSRREALATVLLLWAIVPATGSIPYAVGGGMSWTNALFESVSGFTATGATVLQDFGDFGPVTFLWRATSQWIGGVGIIVAFIAVFPQLAIAGRQLFFAEAPGPTEERLTPRLAHTANAVLTTYLGLTLACAAAYLVAGLGPYDAVAHALTTLSAGGFSPESRSFEAFGPAAQWVAIVFMVVAGANFALQYRAFAGRPSGLLGDAEFRAYLSITAVLGVALTVALVGEYGMGDAVRHGLFQVLALVSTTGFASADFAAWPPGATALLVLAMFVGGSAGSAAGGVKIVRWLIVAKNAAREVRRSLHPRAVLPVRVGKRTVPDEVVRAVSAFVTTYLAVFAALTVALASMGVDLVTAFTAAIACLGNVGPGMGAVGPMANFAEIPAAGRWLLTLAMYVGRLEVMIVFVVFTADWWSVPRTVRSRLP